MTGTDRVNKPATMQARETMPCSTSAPCSPTNGLTEANVLISPPAKSLGWPVSSTLLIIGRV